MQPPPRLEPRLAVEQWPFEDASLTLYTRPVAPHGPVVLLVHGWGGHAGQMLALADQLAAHRACAPCSSRCRRTAAAAAR
jgi:predicted esterase